MEKNENGYSEYFARNGANTQMRGGTQNRSRNDGCSRGNIQNGVQNVSPSGEGRVEWQGMGLCNSPSLAMVYSPCQMWRMLYSTEDALAHGTLFEELYKPLEDCYGK